MWIKFLSVCLLATLVRCEYLYDANPYAHFGGYATAYDNYKPTNYKFEYGVSDPHTGDHKSQWEVKENGVVRGAYSLLEPDGTTRVVEYYADDTGFHADVKKIGTAVHAAPAHYGHLHSLADAHVAHNLAYNGYGHGGVTHSYGHPIAAVAKVALPAPAPIHAAPIAQVAHIAPVPQLIAPQIHHVGTPTHYDYPQYPQPQHHHQGDFIVAHHEPAPHYFEPAPAVKVVDHHHDHHAYAAPEVYAPVIKAAPQYFTAHQPEYYEKSYAAPVPVVAKGYAPEVVLAAKPTVAAVNPFARFFAPLTKFFAPPPTKTIPIAAPVVHAKAIYADAPKIVDHNVSPYHGYKQEVVVASPHGYGPSPAYTYSHDY